MKGSIRLGILAAGIVLSMTIPSRADCVPRSPQPAPPAGSTIVPLPDGSSAWVHSGAGQAGVRGPHGYLVVQTLPDGARIWAYSNDTTLNTDLRATATGSGCVDIP